MQIAIDLPNDFVAFQDKERAAQSKGLPVHGVLLVGQAFVLRHQVGTLTQHGA